MPSVDCFPKTVCRTLRQYAGTQIVLFCLAFPVSAAASPADICDQAAAQIADETNVPLSVLRAITRTETGRTRDDQLQPWPWTVNMEGKGVWFDNEDQARAYVFRHFKRGARSFDVGCFQLNYKWHGQAFRSIDEMFDPELNARYAAGFLRKLHTELGDWSKAAGAYHSRTKKYASKYRRRFDAIRGNLPDVQFASKKPAENAPRVNGFPLLQSGTSRGSNGSLVPRSQRGQSLFASTKNEG